MDINRINNILTAPTNDDKGANQTKQNSQNVAEQSSPTTKPDVELSEDSQKINQITDDLISEPVVDQAKVDRIKAQIQEGTYKYLQADQAQLESLAEKFIGFESDIEDLL